MNRSTRARRQDVWVKLDGGEHIWKYFTTDRINFSVSRLAPGQSSSVDPGHDGADEICYVVSGSLVMSFPQRKEWVELNEADAVLIPENEPHQIINTSAQEVLMVWCAAPGAGFMKKPVTS